MVKKPVALPADHLAYLRALGDGAVSRGLRVTVERSRGRAIEPAPAGFRRAPSTGELMIKSTVTLWADHLAYLRALGAGVLSEGIRRAVEADRKTPASTP